MTSAIAFRSGFWRRTGAMLLKYFDILDKNHDGYLDGDELAAAQSMMGSRSSAAAPPSAAPKSEAARNAEAFNETPTSR